MPDLARLVRNVSQALGPAATPDRVEAVSRAALEQLLQHPGGETIRTAAGKRLAVVVVGRTDPMLSPALSEALMDAGCHVESIEAQDEDAGQLLMWVSAPESGLRIAELRKRVDAIAARHGACADVQHAALFLAMHPSIG